MRFAYLTEPPFNYRTASGEVTGCDVELARMVFRELGIGPASFVETEFAALLPGLGASQWDMTTGLFATAERKASACFSRPIWALPDGLLVAKGNPLFLTGYASVAAIPRARIAVIRDQFQHRSAAEFGIAQHNILVFETYADAATAVEDGMAAAYASVGRAHSGYIAQYPDKPLDHVTVPNDEKEPAFGCYAFAKDNEVLRDQVDDALSSLIGSPEHRAMVARFGFSAAEVDALVT